MFQRNKHLMDSLSKQQQRYGLLLLRKDTQPRTKTTIADQTRQLRQTASRANSTAKNGSVTLLRQPAWTGRLSENILQVYYIVLSVDLYVRDLLSQACNLQRHMALSQSV